MKSSNSKNKEYIIQCKMNDLWCTIGDSPSKDIAIDLCKYKKKCQHNLKWRVIERITTIKEKTIS